MAHYDIFRELLVNKYPGYGYALWVPNPGEPHSTVEVGDVGYIREGRFHRLFNARLSADHPSHRKFGVPEYHEPLDPNLSEHIKIGTLEPNHYFSHGVSVAAAELDSDASKYSRLPVPVTCLLTVSQTRRLSTYLLSVQKETTWCSTLPSSTRSIPGHCCARGIWPMDDHAYRSLLGLYSTT